MTAADSISYFAFSDQACEELLEEELHLRHKYKSLVLDQPERWRNLDRISVGGVLLWELVAAKSIPHEIEAAYQAAFPELSITQSFSEALAGYDADQLQGLLAGVKGKLFELKYVDKLSSDLLPDGYTAELASVANQPGWDIAITGPDGTVADLLQAKATDSASYVREALERYPEIDIVTTDEIYSQLLLSGGAEQLVASGISNADLQQAMSAAIENGVELDFAPPLLGLALIGLTTVAFEPGGVEHKARVIGKRCGRSYPAWIIGRSVAALSGPLWWLGIPAGVGVRCLTDKGRERRRRWTLLRQQVSSYKKVLVRFSV